MKKMRCIKDFYVMDEHEWYVVGDVFDMWTIDEAIAEDPFVSIRKDIDNKTVGYLKELNGGFLQIWEKDAEEVVIEPKDIRRLVFDIKCYAEIKVDDEFSEMLSEMSAKEYDDFILKIKNDANERLYDLLSKGAEKTRIDVKVAGV